MTNLALTDEQVRNLLKEIMTVDVGDGCRDGRLSFIRNTLGQEWHDYAENAGKHYEVFVLLIEHNTDESYNLTPTYEGTWSEILSGWDNDFNADVTVHRVNAETSDMALSKYRRAAVELDR